MFGELFFIPCCLLECEPFYFNETLIVPLPFPSLLAWKIQMCPLCRDEVKDGSATSLSLGVPF